MEIVWSVVGIAVVTGIFALAVRVPASRRWIAAAVVLVVGLAGAGFLAMVAVLQNMDTDGSIETEPAIASAVVAVATIIAAVLVVRLWPRRPAEASAMR